MSAANSVWVVLSVWSLPVALPLGLGYVWWQLLAEAVAAATRQWSPRHAGVFDHRLSAPGAEEPAHRAYWAGRLALDSRDAARSAFATLGLLLTGRWLRRVTARLARGRYPGTGLPGDPPIVRLLLFLLLPGTALGALLGGLLALVVLVCAFTVLGLLLLLVLTGAALAVVALRVPRRLWLTVRAVRMKCPYPDCYRPLALLARPCPGCGAVHRSLRPGRYGVLHHVCRCGQRLRVVAPPPSECRCPHCDRSLPAVLGRTPVVHLPLVGGTSSGKTMLLAAVVAGLDAWAVRSGLTVEHASDQDRAAARALADEVSGGGWARKTQGAPKALMLLVGSGRRRRLLYLYDPMGEALRDGGSVRAQQYLAHADGILLLVDALADREVRSRLSAADRVRADGGRPAEQGPLDTFRGLTGELGALTGRRGRLPLAAVVPKRDVLDSLDSLPVLGTDVADWLCQAGLRPLVSGLDHDFGQVRHWAVSARAVATEAGGDGELRRAAEPVLWLLSRTGLRLGRDVQLSAHPVRGPRLPGPRRTATAPARTATAARGEE